MIKVEYGFYYEDDGLFEENDGSNDFYFDYEDLLEDDESSGEAGFMHGFLEE